MPRRSSTPRRSTEGHDRTTPTKEALIGRIDDASSAKELDHIWEQCRVLGYSADGIMGQRLALRRDVLKRGGRRG